MTVQRVLGLDVGTKTIGVALGLVSMSLTEPVMTLGRKGVKKDVVQLTQLCQRHQIHRVIVGLPLQLMVRKVDQHVSLVRLEMHWLLLQDLK